jgi:CPA2 family monovalent cation:H+ antiporter-2
MGVFFMSIGMRIDVREIAHSPFWIPLSVVGLFAIKSAITSTLLRLGGFGWGRALQGGLMLGQGGEFAFIGIGYAVTAKLLEPKTSQFVMLVVGLSMFATPLVAKLAHILGDTWEKRTGTQAAAVALEEAQPMEGHVVIAGFGRVGQLLAEVLTQKEIPYVALESDTRLVTTLHAQGKPIYFGDADKAELLEKLQAGRAAAIVLTMDNANAVLHAVRAIRRNYPDIPLFARSRDEKHAAALKQAGATMVIPETLEVGLQLSATVLETLEFSGEEVAETIQQERERRIAQMQNNAPT